MTSQTQITSNNNSIEDTSDLHGFVMLGGNTVFLYHLPMFSKINHMYQAVFRVALPRDVLQQYLNDRGKHSNTPYILGNVPADLLTIPEITSASRLTFFADIFRGLPIDPTRDVPLLRNVNIQIEKVLFVRHFDFAMHYPPTLTYIVFGDLQYAYAAHYLTKCPDFDHVCEVAEVPDWIPPAVLHMGVEVNFPTLSSSVLPSDASHYKVNYFGQPHEFPLNIGSTIWLDETMINGCS